MPMGPIDLFLALITLVFRIWDAVNQSKASAKAINQQFVLDNAKFLEIASKVLQDLRGEIASDNRHAGNAQDSIDNEMRKK